MKVSPGLRIALRYLFSKKTHNAVNVISGVAVVTTAVATMAIVIVLSVFNGFRQLAESRYSRLDPPFKITAAAGAFNSDSIIEKLQRNDIRADIFPEIDTKAFVTTSFAQSTATIKGITDGFLQHSGLENAILSGVAFVGDTLGTEWGIPGYGISQRMAFWPGTLRHLRVTVPRRKGRINPGSLLTAFRSDSICAAGTFSIDDAEDDNNIVFVSLDMARYLSGFNDDEVSALCVYPQKGFDLKKLEDVLKGTFLTLLDIERQNPETFRMINIEKWISFALLVFILVIASFNIISSLTMLIIEKRSNMGVLRSMGLSARKVRGIFVWQGVLLSFFGALAGCVAGVLLVVCQKAFGLVKLSAGESNTFLSIDSYPVALNGYDFLIVVGLVIILSFIVTLISVSTFSANDQIINS